MQWFDIDLSFAFFGKENEKLNLIDKFPAFYRSPLFLFMLLVLKRIRQLFGLASNLFYRFGCTRSLEPELQVNKTFPSVSLVSLSILIRSEDQDANQTHIGYWIPLRILLRMPFVWIVYEPQSNDFSCYVYAGRFVAKTSLLRSRKPPKTRGIDTAIDAAESAMNSLHTIKDNSWKTIWLIWFMCAIACSFMGAAEQCYNRRVETKLTGRKNWFLHLYGLRST